MDAHDFTITDSLIGALDIICKCCKGRNCFVCELFEVRLSVELQEDASKEEEAPVSYRELDIPASFAFKTSINRLTRHDTYYAQRDEDGNHYIVTLPKMGCTYCISAEHMYSRIFEKKYTIQEIFFNDASSKYVGHPH